MEGIVIVGWLFAVVLVILWTLLPFAVFGVKERLNTLINLMTEIRDELRMARNITHQSTHETANAVSGKPIETDEQTPEIQVPLSELYADPATKWFNKNKNE